jgi:hypothetical protein
MVQNVAVAYSSDYTASIGLRMHNRLRFFVPLIAVVSLLARTELCAQDAAAAAVTAPAQTSAAAPVHKAKAKEKKGEYTGPNTVVELAATPMLDEEGKQRLDPDGKPMFNAPIRQQRDKKGHPLFDEQNKPVMQTAKELGYDEHGKKLHFEKEKKVKATPVSISRGVLTVDGLTGKAALNYDIPDLKYIYFYAPGIGITVVSNAPFPFAKEQAGAFDDKTLTVTADGHRLQLASDKRLLGKKPESAYVLVDREFTLPSTFPVMGYGPLRKPPYAWPGAKPNQKLAGLLVEPPPVPKDLLPVQLLQPCPAGQMRAAAPPVLPGQVAPPRPCVPIAKGTAAKSEVVKN